MSARTRVHSRHQHEAGREGERHLRAGQRDAAFFQRLPQQFGELVRVVADLLGEHGEMLRAGDWIIGGAIIEPLVVTAGTSIDIAMPPLGRIALDFTGT